MALVVKLYSQQEKACLVFQTQIAPPLIPILLLLANVATQLKA